MTSGDVVRAIQAQNVQVSGGALGQEPTPADAAFQLTVTTQGRFEDPRAVPPGHRALDRRMAGSCACRTWRASSSARRTTSPIPI